MSDARLSAEARTEFGKGGARRTRRDGKIPAVIYGHGADPRHVSLPAREFGQAIKKGGANVLLTIDIDGKEELTIPKAIQRHPIKGIFEHVDLLAVRRGEKVTIEVPLNLTGEIARGGLLAQDHTTLAVEAEATHLPSEIEFDISALEVGAIVTAGDIKLPTGASLAGDAEQVLFTISEAPTAEQVEADIAGDAPAAEPTEEAAAE